MALQHNSTAFLLKFSAGAKKDNNSTADQTGIHSKIEKRRVFIIALALHSTTHEQTLTLVMRNKKCHYWHMAKCTIQQPRGKILPLSAFLLFHSHSQQHRQSQAKKKQKKGCIYICKQNQKYDPNPLHISS